MAGQKTQVKEQTNDRKYFTMIPNIVLESNLSPLALALYVHLKRKAGDGGACEEGLRALETETGISRSKISQCRAELEAAGLIEICTSAPAVNAPQVIIVLDVWRKNTEHFAAHAGEIPCPPHGHEPAPCPPHGRQRPPYGHACPPYGRPTYSEKTNNKNIGEEGACAPTPPAGPDWDALAREAGIQSQPPPPKPKPKRSPVHHPRGVASITASDDTRIAAYLEFCRSEITRSNAEIITARVKPEWAGHWREVCREYAERMWNVNKIGDMCERCERKARAVTARQAASAPPPAQPNPVAGVLTGAAKIAQETFERQQGGYAQALEFLNRQQNPQREGAPYGVA